MKLIAYLLMALATMAGSISAATAYLVPIEQGIIDDETLTTLTLSAPAGSFDPNTDEGGELEDSLKKLRAEQQRRADDARPEPLIVPDEVTIETEPMPAVSTEKTGQRLVQAREGLTPIAQRGDSLSPELLEILREYKVKFVKSTSFEIGIWFSTRNAYIFMVSVITLVAAAIMVRIANKGSAGVTDHAEGDIPSDPIAIAREIQRRVEEVVADVRASQDADARLATIVDRLGEVQSVLVPAFASARPTIIARLGMSGYAQVMDAFAASERRINRAWSAAADGAEDEALRSLHDADEVLPSLVERLR